MRRRELLGGLAGVVGATLVAGCTGEEAFEPLARLEIARAADAVVDAAGTTAYVATIDGFVVIDLSDPEDPAVLAERRGLLADRDGGPLVGILDVTVEGDRLLVPRGSPGAALQGFLVYDVADPSAPSQVAFVETDYAIHNAFLRDGRAYLAAPNALEMFDVTGDPEYLGSWSITEREPAWGDVYWRLWQLHDVWVRDDVAYLAQWEAGTWLVDVSDPTTPAYVGAVGVSEQSPDRLTSFDSAEAARPAFQRPPGNHHYVQPSEDGSILAVGKESWAVPDADPPGGPSGIDLWDVDDPADPTELATVEPPPTTDASQDGTWTTAHNLDVVGDRLFTSWYEGGVKLFDVADPSAPERLAWWRDPESASFVTAKRADESFFVAVDGVINSPDGTEGVYTFPIRPGSQPDPPTLTPANLRGPLSAGHR